MLIRDYYFNDKADGGRFRNLCYGFSTLLAAFQAEAEAELVRRVEALEAKADEAEKAT